MLFPSLVEYIYENEDRTEHIVYRKFAGREWVAVRIDLMTRDAKVECDLVADTTEEIQIQLAIGAIPTPRCIDTRPMDHITNVVKVWKKA